MKNIYRLALLWISFNAQAQTCDSLVPTYTVDFTGTNAGTTWQSPTVQRNGYCCSASGVDKCVHFTVLADSNTTQLIFTICGGQLPLGALFYEVDCSQVLSVGDTANITPGAHEVTFCKPGTAGSIFCITSLPQGTTGLPSIQAKPAATFAPNPFSSSAQLIFDKVGTGPYSLDILDTMGRLVRTEQVGPADALIHRGSLGNGMYFYLLRDSERLVQTGKILIGN